MYVVFLYFTPVFYFRFSNSKSYVLISFFVMIIIVILFLLFSLSNYHFLFHLSSALLIFILKFDFLVSGVQFFRIECSVFSDSAFEVRDKG